MNRTTAYIALAASLLLVAVLAGLPRTAGPAEPVPPPPTPAPEPRPAPPSVAMNRPGSLSLNGRLSHPYLVPGQSDVFATLEVSAVDVPGMRRAPVNLAVVIDRSGSMAGEKMAQARRAALRLVDLLNEHDRLAIVHYGSDARFFPGAFVTTETKERMRRYIRGITDEGGTNIGEGLQAGKAQLDVARSDFAVNRLILLSDGQPTVGITSEAGLANIARNLRASGTTLTSLGVGADFNEDLMQRLAEIGGGSYGFIRDAEATVALFEKDLAQAGTMVARGVAVSFELPPGFELKETFGRPVTRAGRRVTVTMPDFSARQTEKLVLHLSAAVGGTDGTAVDVADFRLDYFDLLTSQAADTQLKLSALLTTDRSLADQRRDKDAIVFATRARASQNVERAAVAAQRGRFDEAKRLLQDNKVLFDGAASIAGDEAFAADRAENDRQADVVTQMPAAAAPVQSERVKAMKLDAKRGYGLGASVY